MVTDTYNPERDITPEYLNTVDSWIRVSGEVLVIMRYLRGGGSKDFALITSPDLFRQLIDRCPVGTDIIVFRDLQLPLRGVVDSEFIAKAKRLVPDGSEYLYIRTTPERPDDPRCFGEFDEGHVTLVVDLNDEIGESVAFGLCPNFVPDDNEAMISASKGGIDGPR